MDWVCSREERIWRGSDGSRIEVRGEGYVAFDRNGKELGEGDLETVKRFADEASSQPLWVSFRVQVRPGDDPEETYRAVETRHVQVYVVDTRLGADGKQTELADAAKMMANQFVKACSDVLEDTLAALATGAQVYADVLQGLQMFGVSRSDGEPITTLYNKTYTDEDAQVFKFTVHVGEQALG